MKAYKAYEEEYIASHPKSRAAWERAKQSMPLGVGSPIRAFSPFPFFIREGKGSKVWDIDGNQYIDCQLAYGPLMAGHAHPQLIEAVSDQLRKGSTFAMPFEAQDLAVREIQKRFPSMEMVRFGNSGTEVTLHAIRLARGYTGKDRIIKLEGGYHGPHDYALWSIHPEIGQTGPTRLPTSVKMSAGIPKCLTGTTVAVPFNDMEALEYVVRKYEGEIAAFILEPVMGNATVILPQKGYLERVRELTERENIVLIFDEIITGCRVSYGGASEYYDVTPDMTTLSKAIGGGFPIAAFGGKRAIMRQLEEKTVAHFGTYNANPVGITACLTTLRDILTPEATRKLIEKCDTVFEAMRGIINEVGLAAQLQHVGAMGGIAFTDKEVVDYRTMATADDSVWHEFFITMLNKGIIMIGAHPTETIFFSVQHTDEDYDEILDAFRSTLRLLHRPR